MFVASEMTSFNRPSESFSNTSIHHKASYSKRGGTPAPPPAYVVRVATLDLKRYATQYGIPKLSGNVKHALHRARVALDLGLEDFFDSLAQEAVQIIENDNEEQVREFNYFGYHLWPDKH